MNEREAGQEIGGINELIIDTAYGFLQAILMPSDPGLMALIGQSTT